MPGALSRVMSAGPEVQDIPRETRVGERRARGRVRTDGTARRADRAGGVGITSTYWMPPRQWGRGGGVERKGERRCWV